MIPRLESLESRSAPSGLTGGIVAVAENVATRPPLVITGTYTPMPLEIREPIPPDDLGVSVPTLGPE